MASQPATYCATILESVVMMPGTLRALPRQSMTGGSAAVAFT